MKTEFNICVLLKLQISQELHMESYYTTQVSMAVRSLNLDLGSLHWLLVRTYVVYKLSLTMLRTNLLRLLHPNVTRRSIHLT